MEKYYRFAGVDVAVDIPDERMYTDDRALAEFRVTDVTDPKRFTFSVVEKLSPPEGEQIDVGAALRVFLTPEGYIRYIGQVSDHWSNGYMRVQARGDQFQVELKNGTYPGEIGPKAVMNALAIEHMMAQRGACVFHACYVAWQGRAILFTAPSGTGKSTQGALWEEYEKAQVINGDRAVICLEDGQPMAYGIPFSGSSGISRNVSLPLAAIVYLAQASQTSISRLSGYQAFRRVWEGVSVNTWDPSDVRRVSETVEQISKSVPVCYLPCTPDQSAVDALKRLLRKM